MSHVSQSRSNLHAFKGRALDIQIDVETALTAEDISDATFRIGDGLVSKSVTPEDGGSGVTIDLTIDVADLDFSVGQYTWECVATVATQPRTLALGRFTLEAEPTTEAP